jgi:hypothetical protein
MELLDIFKRLSDFYYKSDMTNGSEVAEILAELETIIVVNIFNRQPSDPKYSKAMLALSKYGMGKITLKELLTNKLK